MPTQLPSAKTFFRNQTPIPERPFYALTESQRELRLDTVTWGEREIFLEELIHHPVKRVRMRAWTSNLEIMRVLIRAWKQGIDIAGVYMPSLFYSDWSSLPRAPIAYMREAKSDAETRMERRAIGKGGIFARQRPYVVKPYKGGVKPGQSEVNSQPVIDNPEPEPFVDPADPQFGALRNSRRASLEEILENAVRGRPLTPPPYAQTPEPMPWGPQAVAEKQPRKRGRPPGQSPSPAKASTPLTPPSSSQEPASQEPPEVDAPPPPQEPPAQELTPPELAKDTPQATVPPPMSAEPQEKVAKATKAQKAPKEPPKVEARPRQEQEQEPPRSSRPQNGTVEVEQPPRDPDDPDPDDSEPSAAPPPPPPPEIDAAEMAAIRNKLIINGRVRLDLEALSIYMLAPSFFAIACMFSPRPWQRRIMDSYARRMGVLASRQCGKSLTTAYKVACFMICHPGTTVLILAPTLRQSSEMLLKIAGILQYVGMKIAALNQFQCALADKQPGAGARVISLPGSNEDAGASTRGYAADFLILEEASFLNEGVIHSVLPSMAARPKAMQLSISSAGLVASYFHERMTAPNSTWERMTVTAQQSGQFSQTDLNNLRHELGAKFASEMECKWSTAGEGLFGDNVMEAAFGTIIDHRPDNLAPELDPDSLAGAFGFDIDELFASKPFERKIA